MEDCVAKFSPSGPAAKPLRIGVVGMGFGKAILDQLAQEPAKNFFSLAALCDMNEGAVKAQAEKWNVPAYTSLDEFLRKGDFGVVGLYTQPLGRAKLLRQIIRAGKDVMTTKPFELDARESRSVLEEAAELGRVIHLNSPAPLLSPDLQWVERWRREYDLGRPVGARAAVWAPYHEKADGSWMDDPEKCPAAPLFRLGIYLLNDMNRIMGPGESIQVMTSSLRTGRPTPDNAQMAIRYRNQALGHVSASFCVDDGDNYQNSLIFQFERGSIYRNAGGLRDRFHSGAAEMVLVGRREQGRQVLAHEEVRDASGSYQWEALAEAIRMRRPADEEYRTQIVNSVRYADALRRAQPNGSAEL